jgi:hypothetical protein
MSNTLFAVVGKGAIVGTIVGVVGSLVWFFNSSKKNKEYRAIPEETPKKQQPSSPHKKEKNGEDTKDKETKEEATEDREDKEDKEEESNLFDDTNYAFVQDPDLLDILKHIEPYVHVCNSNRYKEFLNDVSRIVEIHKLIANNENTTDEANQLSPSLVYESSKAQEDVNKFFNYVRECYRKKNMNLSRNFDEEKKALLELLDQYNHNTTMEMQYQVRFKKNS